MNNNVSTCVYLQSTDIPDTDFVLEPHIEEIDRLFNGDTVEEIVHNLKMEGSEWAKKQLDTLSKMVRRKRSAVHYKLSRFLCI